MFDAVIIKFRRFSALPINKKCNLISSKLDVVKRSIKYFFYAKFKKFGTLSSIQKCNIILYKLGKFQKDIELFFDELKVDCYFEDDVNYSIDTVKNKRVFKISSVTKTHTEKKLIIICSFETHEQESMLKSMKLKYGKDYIRGIDLINTLDVSVGNLLTETIKAPVLYAHICPKAFETIQILEDGTVAICTPGSKKIFPGNLLQNTFEEVYNSPMARLIRLSVINGTYCFCTDGCVENRKSVKKNNDIEKQKDEYIEYKHNSLSPTDKFRTAINYDLTCNLKCGSCRSGNLSLIKNLSARMIFAVDGSRKLS